FSQCLWRIDFKRSDGIVSRIPWKKEGQDHIMFDPLEAGTAEYQRLIIHTREANQARQKTLSDFGSERSVAIFPISDSCGLCHKKQSASDEDGVVLIKCGHSFHQLCFQKWKDRKLTCPHCDGPMDVME
ncbi:MAG: hypothetical protein EZS28_021803, partial [Streblomastix strix]